MDEDNAFWRRNEWWVWKRKEIVLNMKEMERQEQIKEKTYRFNRAGGYKLEGDNEVFIEEEERNLDDYIESKNPCKFKFNEEDAKIILNRISKYFLKIDTKSKKLNLSKN